MKFWILILVLHDHSIEHNTGLRSRAECERLATAWAPPVKHQCQRLRHGSRA